jgi:sarcosine oxidase gamma subunit
VGFDERALADAVTVGPNPTVGAVEVRVVVPGAWFIRMLDAQGRTVMAAQRQEGARAMVDLSAMPAGIYVIEVERNGVRSHHRVVRH